MSRIDGSGRLIVEGDMKFAAWDTAAARKMNSEQDSMTGPRIARVEAALSSEAVRVELIDFEWDGVTDSTHSYSDHILVRRLEPRRLVSHLDIGDHHFVRSGNMTFVPGGLPILSRTPGGHAKIGVCHFSPDRFNSVIGLDQGWTFDDIRACGDIRSSRVDAAVRRLIAEAVAPGFASELLLESLSIVALVELSRYIHAEREQPVVRKGGLAPWQMRRLTEYIEQKKGRGIKIPALAELCGLSERHLQRAFRHTKGQALYDFVVETRLSHAKSLLSDVDLSIRQIATELAFSSVSGFSTAFHRSAGETPSSYRRRTRSRS